MLKETFAESIAKNRAKREKRMKPRYLLRRVRPVPREAVWGKPFWGVYFIQAGEDGPIKIGGARNIHKRRSQMQIGNHLPLIIRGYIKEEGYEEEAEKTLHRHFSSHRIRGEWFEPCEELISLWERWNEA